MRIRWIATVIGLMAGGIGVQDAGFVKLVQTSSNAQDWYLA